MAWTNGIDAITLFVEDLEASKAFYGSVFDLPVMFEDADSAVFNFESSVVNLLKTSGVSGPDRTRGDGAARRRIARHVHPRGR